MHTDVARSTVQGIRSDETKEVPFLFDELFFSRTDKKGLIQSGNNVFQRISLYEWDELLRKPHNVIRHGDMPKGVFWLLWDTIKRGEPIGAYVKNRAKDGRHYWVYAIVTPIDDGYLSVRLKPSSEIFTLIEREYTALRDAELQQGLSAADSAARLLARLSELGYKDYPTFMAASLGQEINARNRQLGKGRDETIACFDTLVEGAQQLMKRANAIFTIYRENQYVPLNLRVQSSRLGEAGSTIGVMSNNYTIISDEIKSSMSEFLTSAEQVLETINNGLFLVGTAKIQREIVDVFHQEAEVDGVSREQEPEYLSAQQKMYQKKAMVGLKSIATQTKVFHRQCAEIRRLAAGLEVTRVMGKVESARLPVSEDGLDELIHDLEGFQLSISDHLRDIDTVNRRIVAALASSNNLLKLSANG